MSNVLRMCLVWSRDVRVCVRTTLELLLCINCIDALLKVKRCAICTVSD